MAMRHRTLPIEGVQFHPESVLTQGGHLMLANWLAACGYPAALDRAPALAAEVEAPPGRRLRLTRSRRATGSVGCERRRQSDASAPAVARRKLAEVGDRRRRGLGGPSVVMVGRGDVIVPAADPAAVHRADRCRWPLAGPPGTLVKPAACQDAPWPRSRSLARRRSGPPSGCPSRPCTRTVVPSLTSVPAAGSVATTLPFGLSLSTSSTFGDELALAQLALGVPCCVSIRRRARSPCRAEQTCTRPCC